MSNEMVIEDAFGFDITVTKGPIMQLFQINRKLLS